MGGRSESWSRDRLLSFLDDHAIGYQEVRHEAVSTMEDSARLEHSLQGVRCKNLLAKSNKGAYCLIVSEPYSRTDMRSLGRALGIGRLSFCPADEMIEILGVKPGAMSPFALIAAEPSADIRIVIEKALEDTPHFLLHPLINTATLSISAADLMRFLLTIGRAAQFVDIPQARPKDFEAASPERGD